jgi:hypothetical protein
MRVPFWWMTGRERLERANPVSTAAPGCRPGANYTAKDSSQRPTFESRRCRGRVIEKDILDVRSRIRIGDAWLSIGWRRLAGVRGRKPFR